MGEKYALLKQLIDLYGEYEKEGKPLSLQAFVQWTTARLNEDSGSDGENVSEERSMQHHPESASFIKHFNEKQRFLETTCRIARYHDFYIRKALKDLIINSRLDYLFLYTIATLEKARKTDLISIYHLEYTTGMDTIRRLINNGLLNEAQDESDKRAKLLVLTPLGREVLEMAARKISDENSMFFAALNENKWKKVLPVLEEIDEFHDHIYLKHNQQNFAELSNLTDSLKRLYK
jgi:DNA-binding MarR family transcriptional regulator